MKLPRQETGEFTYGKQQNSNGVVHRERITLINEVPSKNMEVTSSVLSKSRRRRRRLVETVLAGRVQQDACSESYCFSLVCLNV